MSTLRGEFPITYAELVEIFGLPNVGPNADLDKTSCEWMIEFDDGVKASIYDWKCGRWTPMGEYEWHIGGHTQEAYNRVVDIIINHRDKLVKMIRDYESI